MKRTEDKRRSSVFTLIELLVVISIIGVLMGLVLTAVSTVREKGKVTKARAEINAIVTAIKSYEANYGLLPAFSTTFPLATNDYDGLMSVLTNVDVTGGSPSVTKAQNVRNVIFLDAKSGYTDTIDDSSSNIKDRKGSYRDPWGNRYQVIMDHDYDNQIANVVDADDSGSVSAADILYGSVFVYSYGPDMANDAGRIKNAGNDDIVSWK